MTDRQKEIVGIINSNVKISLREIAKQMRLNRSAIDKHMNTLIEAGILKRIGGTRGHR